MPNEVTIRFSGPELSYQEMDRLAEQLVSLIKDQVPWQSKVIDGIDSVSFRRIDRIYRPDHGTK